MNTKNLQLGFYVVLLLAVLVLFYFVIAPYVSAIFLAIITSVLFWSFHKRVLQIFSGRKNIASCVSVVCVLLIFLIPVAVIGNLLVYESASFYSENKGVSLDGYSFNQTLSQIETFIESKFPGANIDINHFLNIGQYAQKGFVWLSSNLTSFFSGLLKLTLSAFLYVLCLFYLFRDGNVLIKNILAWSPLFDSYDSLILHKISTAVNSVLRGQLMVGLIQGFLTGIGFWIFGIPHPVIWGSVAAIASLVPSLGTGLVNVPAILYLFITGHTLSALGLAAWATIAVGLIDNILGPYLINRGVKIHSFLILVSVLGGISLFGPIGFIAGPVVLSLLFALLELYPVILRAKTSDVISNDRTI